MTPDRDEFYVGWMGEAPPGLAVFRRRAAALLAVLAIAVVAGLAASQHRLPDGLFEYGSVRTFEGVFSAAPVPLLVPRTEPGARSPATAMLLCGAGKHGVPQALQRLDGHAVRFRGTLIRKDLVMAEVTEPDALEDLGLVAPSTASTVALGEATLVGEVVDTKCWLGVMRPATGKVHRACAVRCLSGGVPPGLLVRGDDAAFTTVVLAAADGATLDLDPQLAARVIRASGDLELREGVPVLRVHGWTLADLGAMETDEP